MQIVDVNPWAELLKQLETKIVILNTYKFLRIGGKITSILPPGAFILKESNINAIFGKTIPKTIGMSQSFVQNISKHMKHAVICMNDKTYINTSQYDIKATLLRFLNVPMENPLILLKTPNARMIKLDEISSILGVEVIIQPEISAGLTKINGGNLYCSALKKNGERCAHRAKVYNSHGRAVCGVHGKTLSLLYI